MSDSECYSECITLDEDADLHEDAVLPLANDSDQETTLVEQETKNDDDSGYDSKNDPVENGANASEADANSIASEPSSEYSDASTVICEDIKSVDQISAILSESGFFEDEKLSLDVKTDNGMNLESEFHSKTTVKEVIDTLEHEDPDFYDLISPSRYVLPRKATLKETGLPKKSKLQLSERKINVNVKHFGGTKAQISTRRSQTVRAFKQQLYNELKIDVNEQQLMFGARTLSDHNTLRSYNIRNNSDIQLVFRLRGGQ